MADRLRVVGFAVLIMLVSVGLSFGQETAELPTATPLPTVLVTAFAPFAGRAVNGSNTAAQALLHREVPGCHLEVLVLPVVWGAPERELPAVIQRLHPVLMLGLGEGHPGRLVVEHLAHNIAQGRDMAGALPPSPQVTAMGLPTLRSSLIYDTAWFAHTAIPVVAGEDAGTYLCNNLLYVLCDYQTPERRVGFVHLPPQGATDDEQYLATVLPPIITLLTHNLPQVHSPRTDGAATLDP